MQAKVGGVDSARVQVRAKKLLQLCLDAFIANRSSAELQQQPQRSATAVPWVKLLDLVIKLTGTAYKASDMLHVLGTTLSVKLCLEAGWLAETGLSMHRMEYVFPCRNLL